MENCDKKGRSNCRNIERNVENFRKTRLRNVERNRKVYGDGERERQREREAE